MGGGDDVDMDGAEGKSLFSPAAQIPPEMLAKTPFPPSPETFQQMQQYKAIGFPPMSHEKSGEKPVRVLTPCNQWERGQFVQSPNNLMTDVSPGSDMRLTPLGEPHLAEWFASMEDGMFLGVNGQQNGESPLRFIEKREINAMMD